MNINKKDLRFFWISCLVFLMVVLPLFFTVIAPKVLERPEIDRQVQQKTETIEGLVAWYEKDFNDPYLVGLEWKFEEEYNRSKWLEKYKLVSNSFCFTISHNRIEGSPELLIDLEFKKGFRRYFSINLLKNSEYPEYIMRSNTHEFQELAKLKTLLSKLAELGVFHQIPGLPQYIRQNITELTGYF